MTERNIIAQAYDAGVEEEYNRLAANPLFEAEFKLITELMQQYIPEGSTVIDIGAGPGRYAEFLLKRNCKVGLVDLSEKSLAAFEQRISDAFKKNVIFSNVACATDMNFIEDSFADAVFLMGPLYHLTGCNERSRAISEAFRILKKGGFMFAVFLSTFDHPHHHDDHTPCCSDHVKHLLNDAVTTVTFQGYQVPQYKCHPMVAVDAMEPCGFNTLHLRNLEGEGSHYPPDKIRHYQSIQMKSRLFDELRLTCDTPELSGFANQFLYVGQKNL
jgi:ubiquinone/menaquinone biosynthesis C-methylase UbiE